MAGLPPAALIIIVAALSALAGGILTWLVIYLTRDRKPRSPASSSANRNAPSADLLRVVASKTGPTVLVQGERRRHLREIQDRETGEKAVAAVKAVLSFAEGWLPALNGRPDAAAPALQRPRTRDTAPTSPQPRRAAPTSPVTDASGDPLRLVEEIDALLQERLAEQSEVPEREIRLARDVNGRVVIYVGQDRFRSPEEIPDEQVGAFIRETIHIWENR